MKDKKITLLTIFESSIFILCNFDKIIIFIIIILNIILVC